MLEWIYMCFTISTCTLISSVISFFSSSVLSSVCNHLHYLSGYIFKKCIILKMLKFNFNVKYCFYLKCQLTVALPIF